MDFSQKDCILELNKKTISPFSQVKILSAQKEKDLGFLSILFSECIDFIELFSGNRMATQEAESMLTALPNKKSIKDKFFIGFFDEKNTLKGAADFIKNYPEKNVCFLGLLLVSPELRNKGIGAQLYQNLEHFFKQNGVKRIDLIVQEKNPSARNFWEKRGFVFVKNVIQNIGDKKNHAWYLEKNI